MRSQHLSFLFYLLAIVWNSNIVFAQTPSKCLEIESILVDACVPGTGCTTLASPNCNCEGKNEMVRFKTGPSAISISDISITWPNNAYRGISPRNNTTDSLIAILQATVQSPCGLLTQPVNGIIPAATTVLLITSTDMCTGANSFANLNDTLCVIFQNSGNFQGHFANYNATPGLRTLIIRQVSTGCADTVSYERSLLVNTNGTIGGTTALLDGSTVEFSWPGTANYINRGCQAPFVPYNFSISALSILGPNTVCRNDTLNIIASTAGGDISQINWNVHDINNQSINAGVFVNPNGYDIQIATSEFNVQSFYVVAAATGPCNIKILDSALITVVNIPDLSVSANGPLTFCQGQSATLTASTSSFLTPNFSWNNGSTNTTIAVTQSDTLIATSSNACGDSVLAAIIVNVKPLPVSFAGNDLAYCSGDSVQIGTTPTNGYLYSWNTSNGLTDSSSSNPFVIFDNNSQAPQTNNYTVTTTLDGCTTSDNINVIVNPLPVWDAGADVNVCSASSVVTLGNQANGNYQYQWSPAALLNTSPTLGNPTSIALSADTNLFNVTISYFGCTIEDSVKVFVNPTPVSFAGNDVAYCSGDSIQIGTTSTLGYTYSWSTTNGLSNGSVSNPYVVLTNNSASPITQNYTVTTTLGQCSSTDNVLITVNPLPLWDAGSDLFVCSSNPITTLGTAPISAYSYSWSPAALINGSVNIANPTTAVLNNNSNEFNVTISLGNCSIEDSVMVFVLNSPIANAGNDTAICSGSPLTLGSSSNSGYSYFWNNGSSLNNANISNPQFIQTNSGVNPITVQLVLTTTLNGSNCSSSDAVNVTVQPIPANNINSSGPSQLCEGDSIILTANPGYNYIWSNGSTSQNTTIYNAGSYFVNLSSPFGCTSVSAPLSINFNPRPTTSASGGGSVCEGAAINLTATGTGSFTWTGPNGYNNTGSSVNSPNATLANAGYYFVTLTGLNGCTNKDSVEVLVNVNPVPVITPGGPLSFCQGNSVVLTSNYSTGNLWTGGNNTPSLVVNSSGAVNLTVTQNGCQGTANVNVTAFPLPVASISPSGTVSVCNGAPAILNAPSASSYQWSNGATTSSISVSSAGSYTVIITDANGCVSSPSAPVAVVLANATTPVISANGPLSICNGQSVELSSSSSGVNQWSNGSTSASIIVTSPGTYTVTVTDANGCVATSSPVVVSQAIGPVADFNVSPSSGFMPLTVTINNNSTGNNQSSWDFGNGTTSVLEDPVPVTYYAVGNYNIMLTVSNANGCTDTLSKTIFVESEIPNVFSPNGDGKNDNFLISLGAVSEYVITIFNRWGQEVFVSNDIKNSWNGTTNNGNKAEAGVYYFIIQYKTPRGEAKEVKNYLTLVR